MLSANGFTQYEISNFYRNRKGSPSSHNQMYWKGNIEYLAFGMGAASYTNKTRFTRPKTLKKYFQWVDRGA